MRLRHILTVATRNRYGIIVALMVTSVCVLTQCIDEQPGSVVPATQQVATASRFAEFAGSASCSGCHADIYKKHLTTAHYLSSKPATADYVKGIFTSDSNTYTFKNNVQVKMEKRNDSFYQVGYLDGVEKRAERFDIVIGSSRKGQSFLHWTRYELTQLPITWFEPAHQWSNSPGYPGMLMWNRPISARCLECHTTYAHKLTPEKKDPELFLPENMILGVDCERCHGPAAQHVDFYKKNPSDTSGKFIVNPADLTRQQRLDLCALCHGGKINKTKPSFSFTVGQKLTDYFTIDTSGRDALSIDVHGNQFGLMAASACFKKSDMTCTSCHNPHEKEKFDAKVFSSRCMNCHTTGHEKLCKLTATEGMAIANNCIDCHMPKQPSRSIAVLLQGVSTPRPVMMRTHWIKAYPGETSKVLDFIKNKSNSQ